VVSLSNPLVVSLSNPELGPGLVQVLEKEKQPESELAPGWESGLVLVEAWRLVLGLGSVRRKV